MEKTFDALDVKCSRTNGLLQMVNGILCILFNIAILVLMAVSQKSDSGIWGGIFYVVSGALLFAAAKRRIPCLVISALVLNVVALIVNSAHSAHLVFMSISVMSGERTLFSHGAEKSWRYLVYVPLIRYWLILF